MAIILSRRDYIKVPPNFRGDLRGLKAPGIAIVRRFFTRESTNKWDFTIFERQRAPAEKHSEYI